MERYDIIREEIRATHAPQMAKLADQNRKADMDADRQRQERAAEREQAAQHHDEQMRKVERLYKQQSRQRGRDRGMEMG